MAADLTQAVGFFVCLTPIVLIVFYLVRLSRRGACPECEYGIPRNATTCPHCGCSLDKREKT
jgi:hypothetical protein